MCDICHSRNFRLGCAPVPAELRNAPSARLGHRHPWAVLPHQARMQLAQRILVIIQTHNARAYRKYVSGLLRFDARLPVRTG